MFKPGLHGIITLTEGELSITNRMTIVGPRANVLSVSGRAVTHGQALNPGGGMFNGLGGFNSGIVSNGPFRGCDESTISRPRRGQTEEPRARNADEMTSWYHKLGEMPQPPGAQFGKLFRRRSNGGVKADTDFLRRPFPAG